VLPIDVTLVAGAKLLRAHLKAEESKEAGHQSDQVVTAEFGVLF
jgi:hypothetical protein